MSNRALSVFAAPLATMAAGAVLGCSGRTFTVEVINDSQVSVSAWIERDRVVEDPEVLASARVPVDGAATLGPVTAPWLDPVDLVVEYTGGLGDVPRRVRLGRGRSTALVERSMFSAFSGVTVRLVPNDEPLDRD